MRTVKITDPDSGEEILIYPADEYMAEIRAFYEEECKHEDAQELREFTAKNNAKHYRSQCLTCGEAVGQNISKSKLSNSDLPPFDLKIQEEFQKARNRKRDDIDRKYIRLQKDKDVRFSDEYEKYLKTDKWKAKRKKVLERAKGLCEGCLENKATEVHHLTYEHIFDELLFELVALCSKFHGACHPEERDNDFMVEHPCSGCRWQAAGENDEMWCGIHDVPSRIALSPEGECGPERKSSEPLK